MDRYVIEAKDISKNFGAKQVLDQLSLSVPAGSVFGLLGTNGAGKTTLIKCLLGLYKISRGKIHVLGDDPWDFMEATKEQLGYVPQSDRVYPWLTVKELIAYTASFYKHWNAPLIEKLIKEWRINPEEKLGVLSEGEAQKVSIILSLGHEPKLLVLDEPVASLDPAARRQFIKMILQIVSDRECAIFFSTHITSDLERVADQVAVLKEGRIHFHGELGALKDEVKRLHIRSEQQLPDDLGLGREKVIYCESSAGEAIVSVRGFKKEFKDIIEATCKARVEVEDLNLEEIFLELNR